MIFDVYRKEQNNHLFTLWVRTNVVDGVKASTDDDSAIATVNAATAKGETVENIMFLRSLQSLSMYD